MARRRDAAQRAQAPAQEAAQQQEQPSAVTASPPQQGQGLRRRRQQRQQGQAPAADPAAGRAAGAADLEDPVGSMSAWAYYPRQYGGVTLGALACCNTLARYDQEDPLRVWKMMASLGVVLVALLLHETRPFKRMNYGDKARELGMGVGSALGF